MSAIRDRAAVAVVLLAALLVPQVFSQNQAPTESEPKITVRISTDKKRFRPAEAVVLHVEIWNEGAKDIFIFKEFNNPDNPLSSLDMTLYRGVKPDVSERWRVVDVPPFSLPANSQLENALSICCLPLSPGHFYGGKATMGAAEYKRLEIPGRYRIQGRYWSRGFLAKDMNNPLLGYAEGLKKLPYRSWNGQVETNSVWIEVTKPPEKH